MGPSLIQDQHICSFLGFEFQTLSDKTIKLSKHNFFLKGTFLVSKTGPFGTKQSLEYMSFLLLYYT